MAYPGNGRGIKMQNKMERLLSTATGKDLQWMLLPTDTDTQGFLPGNGLYTVAADAAQEIAIRVADGNYYNYPDNVSPLDLWNGQYKQEFIQNMLLAMEIALEKELTAFGAAWKKELENPQVWVSNKKEGK